MANARNPSNLITFRNSQGVQARGSLMKLSRTTLIFEVYNPYSIVQLSEILNDLVIRRGEQVVYKGRAVVSNLVNTGLMLIVSARLIDSWSDLAGLTGDSARVRDEVEAFVQDWRESHQIRPRYQLAVSRIRSFLTELNRWLEHVDVIGADADSEVDSMGSESASALFADVSQPLLPELGEMFEQFEDAAAEVTEDERTLHARYVQRDLHPLLLRAPFVHRAYHKPLGYAGDYEMVNMMLREPREGPTTYAQLINMLHLGTGPAAAHRNRIDILVDWISESIHKAENLGSPVHALNVGCGPAIELQRIARHHPKAWRLQIKLMDFSDETLAYTKEMLESASGSSSERPEFAFIHESVHNLLKMATNPDNAIKGEYDIVYCAGLFDYLSDRVCSRLLRLFFDWVKPGGKVLVTNVHPDNNATYLMEHILEWYLIYRNEDQMRSLVPADWVRRVFVDSTGINVFMELEKPV